MTAGEQSPDRIAVEREAGGVVSGQLAELGVDDPEVCGARAEDQRRDARRHADGAGAVGGPIAQGPAFQARKLAQGAPLGGHDGLRQRVARADPSAHGE